MVGSWKSTAAVAGLLLVLFGAAVWVGVGVGWSSLRYANVPVLHPYPPPGYYQNPFDPTDRGDLIDARAAAKVKADLSSDGQTELDAVATGNTTLLPSADSGRSLQRMFQIIDSNNAQGVVARQLEHLSGVQVGRLPDPNDSSITWCVEERGHSVITQVAKSDGRTVGTNTFDFTGRFWMVRVGGRYLIADVSIDSTPGVAQ